MCNGVVGVLIKVVAALAHQTSSRLVCFFGRLQNAQRYQLPLAAIGRHRGLDLARDSKETVDRDESDIPEAWIADTLPGGISDEIVSSTDDGDKGGETDEGDDSDSEESDVPGVEVVVKVPVRRHREMP